MIIRILALLLVALHAVNGVFMLKAPAAWLALVTGRVIAQTPPGVHFIFDVGWAFLASALGFLLFAWKPQQWGAAAIGAAFPLLHALMHVASMARGHADRLGFDLAAIVAPALIGALLAGFAAMRKPD